MEDCLVQNGGRETPACGGRGEGGEEGVEGGRGRERGERRGRKVVKISSISTGSCIQVALFPGSSAWAEKKSLVQHAQFPQDFWEFGNFRKIRSVTLIIARYADFSRI